MHGTEEAVDGEGVVAEIAPKSRSDRKIDRLGTESTFKLLLEFSIPAVAGMLVQMLYNVIDAVYVGHAVGADGLAATTVANPMMTAMVAVAMLVGVGGNALAAIKLGERKKGVAERVMGNSFVLLLIATAVLWGIAIFALEPILRYSGADGSVLPLALDFMTVIVAGCPLQFIAFGMNNFIRTAGHPNRALGSMLVGTGANVVLGYLFIIVLDGGMRGAGLATVCSWALSALFVMQFFLKKGSPMPLRRPSLSLDPRIALRVCALGIAPCVTQLGFAVSSMIENNLLVLYGAADALGVDGALAVMRVLSAVGLFTFMPAMGIAMGAQPIVGYNYGTRAYGRMKLVLVQAIVLASPSRRLCGQRSSSHPTCTHTCSACLRYMKETAWALVLYLMFIPILPIQTIGRTTSTPQARRRKRPCSRSRARSCSLFRCSCSARSFCRRCCPSRRLRAWLAPSISDITSTLIVSGFLAFEWRRLRAAEAGRPEWPPSSLAA